MKPLCFGLGAVLFNAGLVVLQVALHPVVWYVIVEVFIQGLVLGWLLTEMFRYRATHAELQRWRRDAED